MIDLPKRKQIRIADYDYSTPGAYFITVCIADRKPILWNVGAADCRPYGINGGWAYETVGFYAAWAINLAKIIYRSGNTKR